MREIEYIEIDVEVITETDGAVLVDDGDNQICVPKSVMQEWPEVGETGTAAIADWFCEKEGLI